MHFFSPLPSFPEGYLFPQEMICKAWISCHSTNYFLLTFACLFFFFLCHFFLLFPFNCYFFLGGKKGKKMSEPIEVHSFNTGGDSIEFWGMSQPFSEPWLMPPAQYLATPLNKRRMWCDSFFTWESWDLKIRETAEMKSPAVEDKYWVA